MSPRFKNYRVITETQFNSTNICRVLKSQLNLLSGLWKHMPPKAQLARRGKMYGGLTAKMDSSLFVFVSELRSPFQGEVLVEG